MKNGVVKEIWSWVKTILLAFVIALALNHFVIVNANVPTGSMESTIEPGDRLIGFRLSYITKIPQRGDIVIFKYPVNEKETYIKRVIGLPGEKVEIRNAHVYINDSQEPIDEAYLKEDWVVYNDGMTFQVPDDYYFVMGDNRNDSLDGRYWASEAVKYGLATDIENAVRQNYCFVSKDKILGKAIFRYYPSVKSLNKTPYGSDSK